MSVWDFLPIILPGMLIQLFVQIYYIGVCWKNKNISKRSKGIYIAVIALFHLMGAAVYLFATRSSESEIGNADDQTDAGSQTSQGIFVLLLVIFEIFYLRTFIISRQSDELHHLLGLMLGICFSAMIADGLLLSYLVRYTRTKRMPGEILSFMMNISFALIQIVTILVALRIDRSQNVQFIVLAVLAAVINRHSVKSGAVLSVILFIGYVVVTVLNTVAKYGSVNTDEGISSLYVQILSFMLIFIVFYSLKWQFQTNRQLSRALQAIRSQSLQLEEMSAAAERSRIVGQIHDTVGHTLTTAVISVEAGEKLLEQNKDEAAEKFLLAGRQVRIALQELRNSVRTIQSGERLPFMTSLQQMLGEIQSEIDLKINLIAGFDAEILPLQQAVLLRAVRECITNSLKHGHSQQIDILIQQTGSTLQMAISDDGNGCAEPVWGFGLQNMQNQIQGFGGTMIVESQPDEGFTVNLAIPVSSLSEGTKNG